jgi:hypothetical protein
MESQKKKLENTRGKERFEMIKALYYFHLKHEV